MKGRLTVKNGKYYVIISYQDESGKNKNKWFATGLDEKNNKRAAQDAMRDIVASFNAKSEGEKIKVVRVKEEQSPLFGDYMLDWLEMAKANIQLSTYGTYKKRVKYIAEYFNEKKIRLNQIKPMDIQNYYSWLMANGKSVQECEHCHVNIRRALQIAYRADLISTNPADKIERPKSPKFNASFYTIEQLRDLFRAIQGDRFELIYKLTVLYGLRRSEVCGLRWNSINFKDNTITLNHSVVHTSVNGKLILIAKDRMKNQSSMRTLPLLPLAKEELLKEKERQEANRALYKTSYGEKDSAYVFVDDLGTFVKPQTVSDHFKVLLCQHGLPIIRFHELRHSCASLLIACGVGMKEVQEWLGHSTYSTTADIYSHLNYTSKLNVAGILSDIFDGKPVDVTVRDKKSIVETMQSIFRSDVEKAKETKNIIELEYFNEDIDEGAESEEESEEINLDEMSKENSTEDKVNSSDLVEELQNITHDEITAYRQAMKEMKQLGFTDMDEYLDYLEFKERQKARIKDTEMEM